MTRYYLFTIFITSIFLFACNDADFKEKINFYENGQVKEKYFIDNNNLKQGKALEFYMNGALKKKYNYLNGKLNGRYVEYFSNGKRSIITNFQNGIQIDTTFSFLKNGFLDVISISNEKGYALKEIAYYQNGMISHIRSFFSDGKGEINAFKTLKADGTIDINNSKFATIKSLGKKKREFCLKLYGFNNKDSIEVNIIKNFNFRFSFEADVLRKIKVKKSNKIKFILINSDFINGKVNIQIIGRKFNSSKIIGESEMRCCR